MAMFSTCNQGKLRRYEKAHYNTKQFTKCTVSQPTKSR